MESEGLGSPPEAAKLGLPPSENIILNLGAAGPGTEEV